MAGCLDEAARKDIAADNKAVAAVLEQTSMAGSYFLDPTGALVGEEQFDEGIAYAELDLSLCPEPKRFHDVVAGYNRFDVFDLAVDRTRHAPIRFTEVERAPEREGASSAPRPALRIGQIPGGQPGAAEDRVRVGAALAQGSVQAIHNTCEVYRRHGGQP